MSHTRSFAHAAKAFSISIAITIAALIADPAMAPAAAQSSGCDGIAGQWTITNVTEYLMTINKDGTGSFHTGVNFKWTCHGNTFVYTDGSVGVTTQMTISRDRTHMTGSGTMGETMTAVRNSPLVTAKTAPSGSRTQAANAASKHGAALAGNAKLCAESWPRFLAGNIAIDAEADEVMSPQEIEKLRQTFMGHCIKNGLTAEALEIMQYGR